MSYLIYFCDSCLIVTEVKEVASCGDECFILHPSRCASCVDAKGKRSINSFRPPENAPERFYLRLAYLRASPATVTPKVRQDEAEYKNWLDRKARARKGSAR